MGEKNVDVEKEALEKKIIDADNTKKVDQAPITLVLKLDLHCAGCAKKVKKSIHYIEGVETVKVDHVNNKLTITGKVDPARIKERVEFKTKKKVEIISPKPKKDDKGVKKEEDDTKSNNQKPKEPLSTTVVLKIPLHCDGCSQKIQRIISKIDGVELVKPDGTKNLITVKGTMNVEELVLYLKEKLKRNVVINVVPPKKEDDKGGHKLDKKKVEGGEDKKEKEAGDTTKLLGDDKKKTDLGKSVESNFGGDEKKKNDEAKATLINESEKKKFDDETKTTSNSDDGGNMAKNKDVINKFEYFRHNNYTYTMPLHNNQDDDYGIPVFSTQGGYYANHEGGYTNHGYVMEYPHRTLPPPSPMYLQDPRASETDIFSTENPNACSIM